MIGRAVAVATLVVVAVLVVLALTGGSGGQELHLRFENASQLVKGDQVKIGGVPIGTVETIDLADDGDADVKVRLEDATGPVLDRLSPLAADLAPVARFLDLYRNEFTRSWAQVAAATNVSAASASGRQVNYLRLILPLWTSEALPTSTTRAAMSRANPYPRPGGLELLAQGLESFTCDHTKNSGGSGLPVDTGPSPACRAAKPFTFDGRSALFPTLRPDAP